MLNINVFYVSKGGFRIGGSTVRPEDDDDGYDTTDDDGGDTENEKSTKRTSGAETGTLLVPKILCIGLLECWFLLEIPTQTIFFSLPIDIYSS